MGEAVELSREGCVCVARGGDDAWCTVHASCAAKKWGWRAWWDDATPGAAAPHTSQLHLFRGRDFKRGLILGFADASHVPRRTLLGKHLGGLLKEIDRTWNPAIRTNPADLNAWAQQLVVRVLDLKAKADVSRANSAFGRRGFTTTPSKQGVVSGIIERAHNICVSRKRLFHELLKQLRAHGVVPPMEDPETRTRWRRWVALGAAGAVALAGGAAMMDAVEPSTGGVVPWAPWYQHRLSLPSPAPASGPELSPYHFVGEHSHGVAAHHAATLKAWELPVHNMTEVAEDDMSASHVRMDSSLHDARAAQVAALNDRVDALLSVVPATVRHALERSPGEPHVADEEVLEGLSSTELNRVAGYHFGKHMFETMRYVAADPATRGYVAKLADFGGDPDEPDTLLHACVRYAQEHGESYRNNVAMAVAATVLASDVSGDSDDPRDYFASAVASYVAGGEDGRLRAFVQHDPSTYMTVALLMGDAHDLSTHMGGVFAPQPACNAEVACIVADIESGVHVNWTREQLRKAQGILQTDDFVWHTHVLSQPWMVERDADADMPPAADSGNLRGSAAASMGMDNAVVDATFRVVPEDAPSWWWAPSEGVVEGDVSIDAAVPTDPRGDDLVGSDHARALTLPRASRLDATQVGRLRDPVARQKAMLHLVFSGSVARMHVAVRESLLHDQDVHEEGWLYDTVGSNVAPTVLAAMIEVVDDYTELLDEVRESGKVTDEDLETAGRVATERGDARAAAALNNGWFGILQRWWHSVGKARTARGTAE